MERNSRQVFISYSRQDQKWVDKLRQQLDPLIQAGRVEVWYDHGQIEAGDRYLNEIIEAIDTSGVAILLVSAHFQTSSFINNHELPRIKSAADKSLLRLVWVPISHCLLADELAETYHTLGNPEHPVVNLTDGEADRLFAQIARQLRDIVKQEEAKSETEADNPSPTTRLRLLIGSLPEAFTNGFRLPQYATNLVALFAWTSSLMIYGYYEFKVLDFGTSLTLAALACTIASTLKNNFNPIEIGVGWTFCLPAAGLLLDLSAPWPLDSIDDMTLYSMVEASVRSASLLAIALFVILPVGCFLRRFRPQRIHDENSEEQCSVELHLGNDQLPPPIPRGDESVVPKL